MNQERILQQGEEIKITKFIFTHGHARNIPWLVPIPEQPIPRMFSAVTLTSLWAQHECWQPNTDQPGPILTVEDAILYMEAAEKITPVRNGKKTMQHSVALKLTAKTTQEQLIVARAFGFYLVKIFPHGVTTNTGEGGWNSLQDLYQPITWALELGFIVCLHGEQPGDHIDTYDREKIFMDQSFKKLVEDFPGGRFNVEHISRKSSLEMVGEMPACITGGLTIHHGILTRNDILEWKTAVRSGINPNHHCRPPACRFEDRDAILYAMLHADEVAYTKFHLGPDSAPHMMGDKYCECGCAGLFTAPTAGPTLVDLFHKNGRLFHPAFKAFTVENGARSHRIKVDEEETFTLKYERWHVPSMYGGIIPFRAGMVLDFTPVDELALDPWKINEHYDKFKDQQKLLSK